MVLEHIVAPDMGPKCQLGWSSQTVASADFTIPTVAVFLPLVCSKQLIEVDTVYLRSIFTVMGKASLCWWPCVLGKSLTAVPHRGWWKAALPRSNIDMSGSRT